MHSPVHPFKHLFMNIPFLMFLYLHLLQVNLMILSGLCIVSGWQDETWFFDTWQTLEEFYSDIKLLCRISTDKLSIFCVLWAKTKVHVYDLW